MADRRIPPQKGRIGLHVAHPFHRAILEPVLRILETEVPCLMSEDVAALIAFEPQVLIVCDYPDDRFRLWRPDLIIVFVRHGFSWKRHLGRVLPRVDFACVSSTWVRDDCVARGMLPRMGFWTTGFVPLDGAVARSNAPTGRAPASPPSQKRVVALYAPTFDTDLSAEGAFEDGWMARLLESFPQLELIIKAHPHTARWNPQWLERWTSVAKRNPRVSLLGDHDSNVYDLFDRSDFLITDVSSVMFYYLAMDRPIILATNPRARASAKYESEAPEWAWRDMGHEVANETELHAAVRSCLLEPDAHSQERSQYHRRVFGTTAPGGAAARLAAKVRALFQPGPDDQDWVQMAWMTAATLGRLDRELDRPSIYRVLSLSVVRHRRLFLALQRVMERAPGLRRRLMDLLDGDRRDPS